MIKKGQSCDKTSAQLNMQNVGLHNISNELNIKVYPNPATNEINIIANDDVIIEQIFLMDLSGKVLENLNGSTTLNIQHIASGLYLIEMHTNQGILKTKLIKE